jgi:DNA repair protein RecN (Recombination protein N)
MLKHLTVHNFVIVESLHFDLGRGMCTLTGETGAGKSLILDAIMGVLGQKISADHVRQGCESAYLELGFEPTPAMRRVLVDHGFEHVCHEAVLTLSKTIHKSGSRSRLNGELITQSFVKELGVYLMDSIGQHGNQVLFQEEHHLGLLDELGEEAHQALYDRVSLLHQSLQTNRQVYQKTLQQQREQQREQDFLNFQWQEIQEAELQIDEEELLLAEQERLRYAEQIEGAVESVSSGLAHGSQSVCDRLEGYQRQLTQAADLDARLAPIAAQVESALLELQDASQALTRFGRNIEHSPERLREVESRLDVLNKLMLKYGVDVPSILAYAEEIAAKVENFGRLDQTLHTLKSEGEVLQAQYHTAAEALSASRRTLAKTLAPLIENELRDLGMQKTRFEVQFNALENPGAKGMEQVQFLISPNPGEPLRPLARVASGGEASRLLLAFKLVLKRKHPVPTLIFDEIDAGISGKAARVVAQKLSLLARHHQILCITHLPVIASMADHHYWIEKQQGHQSTSIQLSTLGAEDRLERLAQMTSGQITDSGLEGARELYEQAQQYKSSSASIPFLRAAS